MSEHEHDEDGAEMLEAALVGFDGPLVVVVLTTCPNDPGSLHLTVGGTAEPHEIPLLLSSAAEEYERRRIAGVQAARNLMNPN